MTTWILVADAGKARIFCSKNLRVGELELVKEFSHPESRKKATDLVADRQGRYKANGCGGAYVPKNDPKIVAADHFALLLAKELLAGEGHNQYKSLVIVAPAHFYSLVHKHLSGSHADLAHINKDYTKFNVTRLTASLQQHLVALK